MPSQQQLRRGQKRARVSLLKAKPGSLAFKLVGGDVVVAVPIDRSRLEVNGVEGGFKRIKGITFLLEVEGFQETFTVDDDEPQIGWQVVDNKTDLTHTIYEIVPNDDHWLCKAGQHKS